MGQQNNNSTDDEAHYLKQELEACKKNLVEKDQIIHDLEQQLQVQKNAEEEVRKFRTITDQSNYGTAIASLEGTLLYLNEAFANMHGWHPDELIGKPLMKLHTEEQLAQVKPLLEVIQKKGDFVAEEVWRKKKDGTVFPSLMNAQLILDDKGQPQYMSATTIDISKIKETENALIESQERLNLAQEIARMGSWDFNVKTGHVRWSRNYYKLLGVDPNQSPLSLEEIKKFIHPADLGVFEASLKTMAQTHKKASIEFRIKMPGQNWRWIQADIMPYYTDNELASVHGVSIDITERKEHEDKIRKLSLAIEQSPVAIVITDLEANIQYISPSFTGITGYSAKDAIGQNTRILKSGFTKDETYDDLWKTIKSGKSWTGEWINKKKDRSFYWESIKISPIHDKEGVISNYLAVKEDISIRKQAEQKILDLNINLEQKVEQRTRELADANAELLAEVQERKKIELELIQKTDELEKFFTVTLDLLCIADSSGIFLKANNAWESILGFPVQEVENRSFKDFIHPEDFQKVYQTLEKLTENESVFNYIVRLKTKNGFFRDIEWPGVKVEKRIYAAARDITERVKLERTLQESIYKEKELNGIKSRFVSMASHEFRTPLASIMLSCESLISYWKRMDEQQIVAKLNNILKQTQHLSSIVTKVMDVSKIQEGKVIHDPVEIDFLKLCQDTIRDFNADASLKNKIRFETVFRELHLRIDKRLILQALFNLLSNAIKYSQPEPVVLVNLEITNNKLVISVKDNGMGIPLRDQKHIFQPFFRADNARNLEGNGLGLNIVRESIRIQGGEVSLKSKQGTGSTFFVTLPKEAIVHKQLLS